MSVSEEPRRPGREREGTLDVTAAVAPGEKPSRLEKSSLAGHEHGHELRLNCESGRWNLNELELLLHSYTIPDGRWHMAISSG